MSSGTMGEADAKFPTASNNGIPPSPTRENPAGVYPKSDPQAEQTNESNATGFDPKAHTAALQQGMDAETRAGDALTSQKGGLYTD